MVSTVRPRSLSPELKRSFFFKTAGTAFIILGIYFLFLLCFILFGRRDKFILDLIFLIVIGISTLAFAIYELFEYKKGLMLAKDGLLTQSEIVHIKAINSMVYELTYNYQVSDRVFKNTYGFTVNEKGLFQLGKTIDILYNEKNPKQSCVARHVFTDMYPQPSEGKDKWWVTALIGLFFIALSVIEYVRISHLERTSTSGYIILNRIESLFYHFFGKMGVTVFFGGIGIFAFIYALTKKKQS